MRKYIHVAKAIKVSWIKELITVFENEFAFHCLVLVNKMNVNSYFGQPSLTQEAADKIANQYSELRDQENISNEKAKVWDYEKIEIRIRILC